MPFNTAGDRIYLVEVDSPFDRIEFQFIPENMTWNRKAAISKIPIVGRNNDKHQFVGGADTLSFGLDFYSDQEDRRDVLDKVKFLQSLSVRDGGFGPAKNVKLVFGNIFRSEVWIVESVSAKFGQYHEQFNLLPVRAKVDIKLILDPNRNRRIRDVRG